MNIAKPIQLPSPTPPLKEKLGLVLRIGSTGMLPDKWLRLEPVTLANQTERNMALSFKMAVRIVDGDGKEVQFWLDGRWDGGLGVPGPSEPLVSLAKESAIRGSIVFDLPHPPHLGLTRLNIDLEHDLQQLTIYDRISGIMIGANPHIGYPPEEELLPAVGNPTTLPPR
jgi:hypothetical protein